MPARSSRSRSYGGWGARVATLCALGSLALGAAGCADIWGFDDLTQGASEAGIPEGGAGNMDAPSTPDVTVSMEAGDASEAGPDAMVCSDGVLNDALNCGGCGNVCDNTRSLGASCEPSDAGTWSCVYTGCASGLEDCDSTPPNTNGCETSMTSTSACGACGTVCDDAQSVGASCVIGSNGKPTCVYQGCKSGFADCVADAPDTDGCETSITTAMNCGMCGRACDSTHSQSASCPDGNTCQYTGCNSGYVDCMSDPPDTDGCETLQPSNTCAACGGSCDTSQSNFTMCDTSGAAVCEYSSCKTGFKDCNPTPPDTNGCETNITTAMNCGDCGVACDTIHSNGATCTTNVCTYSGCAGGYLDCIKTGANADGCESSASSTNSCGGCGNACNTATGAGKCNGHTCSYTCIAGSSDCNAATAPDIDGCECKTPGCCGAGCQTTHTNGIGASFYDCSAQGTQTAAAATEACEASAGAGHCTSSSKCCGLLGTCLLASTAESVCGVVGSACYCWQWSGGAPGTVQSEPVSACTASCGATSDTPWN